MSSEAGGATTTSATIWAAVDMSFCACDDRTMTLASAMTPPLRVTVDVSSDAAASRNHPGVEPV